MHERWPFFRALISNMAMVLAKSDLLIAEPYVALVADVERAATAIFERIRAEHARPSAGSRRITGHETLLADNPALARSIRNRFAYLVPLHRLQVEMLRRCRAGDDDELVARAHRAHDQRPRHRPAQHRLTAPAAAGTGRRAAARQPWVERPPSTGMSTPVSQAPARLER